MKGGPSSHDSAPRIVLVDSVAEKQPLAACVAPSNADEGR
jgi:hypothetical protein